MGLGLREAGQRAEVDEEALPCGVSRGQSSEREVKQLRQNRGGYIVPFSVYLTLLSIQEIIPRSRALLYTMRCLDGPCNHLTSQLLSNYMINVLLFVSPQRYLSIVRERLTLCK